MFSHLRFIDVLGFLSDGSGIGLILLNSDLSTLESIRKEILHKLNDAGLIQTLRIKPKRPIFEAYIYTETDSYTEAYGYTGSYKETFRKEDQICFSGSGRRRSALQDKSNDTYTGSYSYTEANRNTEAYGDTETYSYTGSDTPVHG
jgi:hypothetical protein